MRNTSVALTPRQRQTYDAVYAVTGGGAFPWTGNLKVAGLSVEQIQADLRALREFELVRSMAFRKGRRLEILVGPDALGARCARPRAYLSKLHAEGPAVNTVERCRAKPDSGAFSVAFRRAFPNRDYRGLTIA